MSGGWSNEDLFHWFVIQQQQAVMVHLGKMVHPATGKIERDLEAARFSIDLLGMLEEKTRGNLNENEGRLVGQVLATLRLNFVEEARRPPSEDEKTAAADASTADASTADASTAATATADTTRANPAEGGDSSSPEPAPNGGSSADGPPQA